MESISDVFSKMKIIESLSGCIGFPHYSSEEVIKRAMAGYISYNIGINSIDYCYNKYLKDKNFFMDNNSTDDNLLCSISNFKAHLLVHIDKIRKIEKPDIPSLFASSVAYFRLENSFSGALLCIRTGLFIKALLIERTILEQIAWIYKIYNCENNFFEIKPNKCIKNLKKLFVESGNIYGYLSKYLHLDSEITPNFVSFKDSEGEVIMSDPKYLISSMSIILVLYDWYCIIGEIIYADYMEEFSYIEKNSKKLLKNRPSLKLKKEILELLNK